MTTLISPSGERVEIIWLRPFCKKHGLCSGNMTRVIQGERQHHKGWRLADTGAFRRKPYAIERYQSEARATCS